MRPSIQFTICITSCNSGCLFSNFNFSSSSTICKYGFNNLSLILCNAVPNRCSSLSLHLNLGGLLLFFSSIQNFICLAFIKCREILFSSIQFIISNIFLNSGCSSSNIFFSCSVFNCRYGFINVCLILLKAIPSLFSSKSFEIEDGGFIVFRCSIHVFIFNAFVKWSLCPNIP